MTESKRTPQAHRWALAACAGLSLLACDKPDNSAQSEQSAGHKAAPAQNAGAAECCIGKNECKGKGGCGTDAHACKGQNECKGQGGCNMHCPK